MLSSSSSSSASADVETNIYSWTIDLVWRNRSWKDIPVFFDKKKGSIFFCKPESDVVFHSLKFPELCFGIKESFEEHLVIVHAIQQIKDIEHVQSQVDAYFCYFSNESQVDQFRIVLGQALHAYQSKKRFLVIMNRESGPGKGIAKQIYEETVLPMLYAASCTHVLRESEYNRHIPLFASQLDPEDFDGVILIGGDGTVNEFLNGLYSRKDFSSIISRLPLTIVPCGSKLQLASRFNVGDAALAIFSALRDKTYDLYPIAFVQARRRFYGHSYLQIKPKQRLYVKLHYLNSLPPVSSITSSSLLGDTESSTFASSTESFVNKGPILQHFYKFSRLDDLGKDVSTNTIAIGPTSDVQLTNTFDPSQNHPLAIMSQSTETNPVQRLWRKISCQLGKGTDVETENWPRLLAMTKAGFLQIEDTLQFPPSKNKDRLFVDGELIGTESVYFESLDKPVKVSVPPDYLLDGAINNK